MAEADYARAIKLAIDRGLVDVDHAKDVVPAIDALCGCSVRTAQVYRPRFLGHRIEPYATSAAG